MDWTKFDRKIRIKAPITKVFNAWIDPSQITVWFLKEIKMVDSSSTSIVSKTKTIWIWNNYPVEFEVEYYQVKSPSFISFSFGDGMIVDLHLSEENEYTTLHLHQKNIPTTEESKKNFYTGCSRGWSFWMTNLKCWLEHGIVLHDKDLANKEDLFDYCNT